MRPVTGASVFCVDLDYCVFDFHTQFASFINSQGLGSIPPFPGSEGCDPYISPPARRTALRRYYAEGRHLEEKLRRGARPTLWAINEAGATIYYISSRPPLAGPGTLQRIVGLHLPGAGIVCAGGRKIRVIESLQPTHLIDDDPLVITASRGFEFPPFTFLISTSENTEERDRVGWKKVRREVSA